MLHYVQLPQRSAHAEFLQEWSCANLSARKSYIKIGKPQQFFHDWSYWKIHVQEQARHDWYWNPRSSQKAFWRGCFLQKLVVAKLVPRIKRHLSELIWSMLLGVLNLFSNTLNPHTSPWKWGSLFCVITKYLPCFNFQFKYDIFNTRLKFYSQ